MKDYIIVGLGLSGACMARRLEQSGHTFVVFEDDSQHASRVAGGFMNPVVLKRFTLAWNAYRQQETALPFYRQLEKDLGRHFLYELEIYRKFVSAEEQNNWFDAADKPGLAPFLDTTLRAEVCQTLPGPYKFGKVVNTHRVDTTEFLDGFLERLKSNDSLILSRFDYDDLELIEEGVSYKGMKARKIVFCDGFGLKKNPYFNYLPLTGNKGEYIIIRAPDLHLEVGVKSSVFIFPVGDDHYAVGATYNNEDKTPGPSPEARIELVEKLRKLITVDFEVVNQVAGLRPSTRDRRPLVGQHPVHKSLFCCNGFGSRGILMAPLISEELLQFMEREESLPPEIDIARFTQKWYSGT